jgi:hypothetical protein
VNVYTTAFIGVKIRNNFCGDAKHNVNSTILKVVISFAEKREVDKRSHEIPARS